MQTQLTIANLIPLRYSGKAFLSRERYFLLVGILRLPLHRPVFCTPKCLSDLSATAMRRKRHHELLTPVHTAQTLLLCRRMHLRPQGLPCNIRMNYIDKHTPAEPRGSRIRNYASAHSLAHYLRLRHCHCLCAESNCIETRAWPRFRPAPYEGLEPIMVASLHTN